MRTRTRTAFEEFLIDHGACDAGMWHVGRHRGDFERSLRALLPVEEGGNGAGYVIFLLDKLGWYNNSSNSIYYGNARDAGRFLRREATKRGWMR